MRDFGYFLPFIAKTNNTTYLTNMIGCIHDVYPQQKLQVVVTCNCYILNWKEPKSDKSALKFDSNLDHYLNSVKLYNNITKMQSIIGKCKYFDMRRELFILNFYGLF